MEDSGWRGAGSSTSDLALKQFIQLMQQCIKLTGLLKTICTDYATQVPTVFPLTFFFMN